MFLYTLDDFDPNFNLKSLPSNTKNVLGRTYEAHFFNMLPSIMVRLTEAIKYNSGFISGHNFH
jgi:hypothetical protein